ncbi:MAG TPA: hypothetical protein VFL97_06625 [Nitrococcus sp.]|nr:hypothetical protein [Nitrococcus sp.]
MKKLTRGSAFAAVAMVLDYLGLPVASAMAPLGMPLRIPAQSATALAPVTGPAPNMLNRIALPVPYAKAMRALAARPHPKVAAPVIGRERVRSAGPRSLRTGGAVQAQSLSCTPPAAAPELVELARALKYDPDLIYEYVYDNITTLAQYGSLKGPLGALLDGAGTPFDQAELMYVLLQQSCYSPQYELGQIHLTSAQYTNWLGTDTTFYSVAYALGSGGFPTQAYGSYSDVTDVTLGWAWVKVTINGTAYVFDPSTKTYARSAGLANLGSALGYSQSGLISDVESGATINPTDISGLARSALRNDLSGYASNLVDYIRTHNPTATTADIIGGKRIEPLPVNTHLRQTALPIAYGSVTDYSTLPSQYRTTMAVSVLGASTVTFNTSDVYGHRLSLFFNSSNQPVLLLDGVVEATGSVAGSGSQVGIGISVTHPYPSTFADQSGTLNVLSGGTYVISNGWGPVGRGMIERHRRLLQENQAALPGNSTDESVLGESLAMIGYTWLAQNGRIQQLTDQLGGTLTHISTLWASSA